MKTKLLVLFSVILLFSCNNLSNPDKKKAIDDSIRALSMAPNKVNVNQILNFQRFKKIEKFTFINKKGFTYRGKGGTVLVFPPNVFNCSDGDSVKISICEYADLSSIINANLSTATNDNEILETNGMVYCKAYANDKELELKKGKSFTCMFNKTEKKDFKLFQGAEKDGTVYWSNPTAPQAKKKTTKIVNAPKIEEGKKEALRICAYGTGSDISEIESSLKFVFDSTLHFMSYFFEKYNIPYVDLIPLSPEESIVLYFTLTSSGKLVFNSCDNNINSRFKSKLAGCFETMPKMNGYINKATGAKEDLSIFINLTPNDLLSERLKADKNNLDKINKMIAEKEAKEKEIQIENEKREKERIAKDKLEYEKQEKERIVEEKIELEKQEKMRLMMDETNKIVFTSAKMGWINCDRFYKDQRPKTDVLFAALDDYSSFSIRLVFTNIKSVQIIYSNSAPNLPVDEPIKIIFVGIKDNAVYFYHKNITTSANDSPLEILASRIDIMDLNNAIEKCLN
jgi:hypothetical protein